MTDPLVEGTRVAELVAVLTERGETVATAESLTAGLLAATIACVPGASAVLRGGLVVYATDLKSTLGGVDRRQLAQDGPVSASTAHALAEGARERCGADWGIGLTGVAGPDTQDGHPVGTVFLSISGASGTSVRHLGLAGDRWSIRKSTVSVAVSGLLDRVQGTSAG
ncbi:CinA family protein [Rhodococcus marinonascens]|uniref:CinA family protein n=1 Tax=Rhodococcus marinonascens TaxID=38311 RepID=UPI00093352F1|nr:nicotinamide-nucleotide amidohydrolase family protein [Rhodococcus marinonascens]